MTTALLAAAPVCAWPARADAPAGTYETTDSTATDANTRLEWQRGVSASTSNLAGAESYCAALGGGWRLPSVLELASLIDETRTGSPAPPAIDPTFSAMPEFFWSATRYAGPLTPTHGWVVNFANGDTLPQPASTAARARCVR